MKNKILNPAAKSGLGAVFLLLFLQNIKAQHNDHVHHDSAKRFFHFHIAEIELSSAPKEKEILSNTSGLLDAGFGRIRMPYFVEYNFTTKGIDYSVSMEAKLTKLFYLGLTVENDFFGEKPETGHIQAGAKVYLQDYKWFSKPFQNFNFGVNRSLGGTAIHRKNDYEFIYNFLTNPIWVNKNIGIVFSSMGRIRENHDLIIFQAGIESTKLHSIFMLGTGQVYDGKTEFFVGLQYAFVQNHKKFSLR